VAGLVGSVFAGTAAAVTRILQLLLLPVLAFYFLRDYDRMLQSARDLLPFSQRDRALRLGREFDRILGGYVRGQLTVCACLAVLYATGLWLAGIEGGVPVGLLAGALFLLPYLGSVLGLVTALSLALVQYGADRHLLYVLATFGVAQGIESWFLTPRIVGERLGLHPVAVILALFAGGELLGFFGVLIALPLAALGKVALTSALSELGREAR
jgi:predicted PurR-regulated permease PerM